jgi:hypothetical protein
VEHNNDLTQRMAALMMKRRKGEGVSTAQLKLFLDTLGAASPLTGKF